MTTLDRDSSVPFYAQIEESLRDQIESGELPPLSRVPSEFELAARFSVSRMTARKSVDRLVSEGYLFRRQGKGTFVAAPQICILPRRKPASRPPWNHSAARSPQWFSTQTSRLPRRTCRASCGSIQARWSFTLLDYESSKASPPLFTRRTCLCDSLACSRTI